MSLRNVMDLPMSIDDVQRLIRNQVAESISLDYKSSGAVDHAKRREIAKDVSAFANSAGGIILYGLREEKHLPVAIDCGVDHRAFTREWLEQVILSSVSPRLDGLSIAQVHISDTHSVYAVRIEQSVRGPHQVDGEGRYYKRFNFQSVPMAHYEIEDVRFRSSRVPALLFVDVAFEGSVVVYLVVKNVGAVAAENVRFGFDPAVAWPNGQPGPRILVEGATSFPPGREMRFFYGTFPQIAQGKEGLPQSLRVTVTYWHPTTGADVQDSFRLDFLDFLHSSAATSDVVHAAERVERMLKELHQEVRKGAKSLDELATLATATGLAVSIPTLQSLSNIIRGDGEPERIPADYATYDTFKEALRVDHAMAYRLYRYFSSAPSEARLAELEGMTPELLEKVRRHFYSSERDI